MLRKHRVLLCAVALAAVAVIPVRAQECADFPASRMRMKITCPLSGGICKFGEPVQFQLIVWDSPATPVPSCVTASWSIEPTVGGATLTAATIGGESFSRLLEPGNYLLWTNVQTQSPVTHYGVGNLVQVGRGSVQVRGPERFPEGSSGVFTLSRSNADVSTNITWRIGESNALSQTAGVSPRNGVVTLEAGETSKQVTVQALDNSVWRYDNELLFQIVAASNGYQFFSSFGGEHRFTINEDDWALVEFTQAMLAVRENAGAFEASVRRSGNLDVDFSVSYYSDGSSIGPASGTLHFAPHETLKTFTVPVRDNAFIGTSGPARLGLRGAGGDGFKLGRYMLDVDIQDDEPVPVVVISDIVMPESNSGRRSGAFVVKLEPLIGGSTTLRWNFQDGTAINGTDYFVASPYGSTRLDSTMTQATIPFEIIGDTTHESNETFTLNLSTESSVPHNIAAPRPVRCTIANDDGELVPSNARLTRGQSMKFLLDIGLPAAAPLDIPLRVSDPGVLSLPPVIHFNAGQSIAQFLVTGAAAGAARITAALPPENGSQSFSTNVAVTESGTAVFEPDSIRLIAGEEATVRISLKPASAQEERLQLTSGNGDLAAVSSEVAVPAGGSGTFKVKGLAPGATYVKAFLPPLFGDGYVTALVDVLERPATPAITSIEPARGPAAGGTPFVARGALLTGDCTLLFGGAPATRHTLTSEGMLLGVTPTHAAGPVDVTLQCGTSTFVLTNAFTYTAPSRTRSARH